MDDADHADATAAQLALQRMARANRVLGIIVTLVDNTRASLGIAVDAFLLHISGSNLNVGLMEGFSGIGSIFVGSASGLLADRIGRSALLRASSAASLLRAATLLAAVVYVQPRASVAALCAVLFSAGLAEGLLMGFQMAPLDALFADSTGPEERTRYFTLKGAASNVGLAAGPAVAAVIFWATTDSWTLSELSAVILAAVGFGVAEGVLLLPLRDVQQTYRRSDQRSAPRALGDGRSPEARGLNVVAAMSTAKT